MSETDTSYTSNSIAALAKGLSSAQKDFPPIPRTCDNPYFKSKYADLATIIEKTKDTLSKNGLSVTQLVMGDKIYTILMHESGEWVRSEINIKAIKSDPQAQGSAITYARRYAVSAILNVASEDDDDANAHSQSKAQTAPPPPTKQQVEPPNIEPPPPEPPQEQIPTSLCSLSRARNRIIKQVMEEHENNEQAARTFVLVNTGKASSKELTIENIKTLEIALAALKAATEN